MKLLRVQYFPPSVAQGARIKCDDGENRHLQVPYNYEDITAQKNELAAEFARRFYPELNVRNVGDYKGQTFFELTKK